MYSCQLSDVLVSAFCHERQARRSFKASRMLEVVDLETGQAFDDAAELLANYPSDDSTYGVLRECGLSMQVLAFIDRCDGKFHEFEKNCITEYVMSQASTSVEAHVIAKHVESLYPDADSFEHSLRLATEKGVAETRKLISWINKVVEADRVPAGEEFA
jgi:hypothetical protein